MDALSATDLVYQGKIMRDRNDRMWGLTHVTWVDGDFFVDDEWYTRSFIAPGRCLPIGLEPYELTDLTRVTFQLSSGVFRVCDSVYYRIYDNTFWTPSGELLILDCQPDGSVILHARL